MNWPKDFETGNEIGIPIADCHIGNPMDYETVRFYMFSDGTIIMAMNKEAGKYIIHSKLDLIEMGKQHGKSKGHKPQG